jgi:hypothetical protein
MAGDRRGDRRNRRDWRARFVPTPHAAVQIGHPNLALGGRVEY